MAHEINGVTVFDGDGNDDAGFGDLAGDEVRLTLEIGGTKYGFRGYLRPGFPESIENEELWIQLHALKLAEFAGGAFIRYFTDMSDAEAPDDGSA